MDRFVLEEIIAITPVGRNPEVAKEMLRHLEHLFYEGRLRELEVFGLKMRKFQGDIMEALQ